MIQFRKYHHPACNCLTFKGTLLEKFSHTPKLPSNYLCQLQHPSSEGFVLDRSSSYSSPLICRFQWFAQSLASFWIESFSTADSINLLATSLCRRCQHWPYLSLLLCECATNVLGSGRTGTSSTAKKQQQQHWLYDSRHRTEATMTQLPTVRRSYTHDTMVFIRVK